MYDGLRGSPPALGPGRSAQTGESDIDESGLLESIKALLKMIRELKVQIAEKRAQIDALDDQSLDPQARRLQLEALQTELVSFNSALRSSDANLIQLMRKNGLSNEQEMTAAGLAMV